MALGGGTFVTQNKVLPGAYVNFVNAARASATISDRGIVAMPVVLDWGPVGEVMQVETATFEKQAVKMFGYDYTHEKLTGLRDLFSNVRLGYLYRVNKGGSKAANSFAQARYEGVRGNALSVAITAMGELFEVVTLLDGVRMDVQSVRKADELKENDFVSFQADATLAETAGEPLVDGSNGTVADATYQVFLDQIEQYSFHALGCLSDQVSVKKLFADFTKRMRDQVGVKFQTVLHRFTQADYEGVISVENGVNGDGQSTEAVWWVTGAQAGCAVNRSLTNKTYDGGFDLDVAMTQTQLEEGLHMGRFLFHRVGNQVRVLEDINSFVHPTSDKSEDFSANQTVRVCDQIANDIAALFNEKYLGQTPNDAAGRIALWNDIVRHHQQMQNIHAIEGFKPEHVRVERGELKKSVVVTDQVYPVCAMSQFYMTVVVA